MLSDKYTFFEESVELYSFYELNGLITNFYIYVYQYFNNELYEAERYDSALKKYEDASLKTSTSLALLNFGQNVIFSGAISYAMLLAVESITAGMVQCISKLYC